mmetsp:Transcript_22452/g.66193  ORF Transcript_22452/g.66193 Transcript_22452/m.66193 type:complete len:204 (-) Transcript_22452:2-613(-)
MIGAPVSFSQLLLVTSMRSPILSSVSLSISPNSMAISSIFCFCSAISASLMAIASSLARRVSSCARRASSSSSRCWVMVASRPCIFFMSSSCIPLYWRVMSAVTSNISSFSFVKSAWNCITRSLSSFWALMASIMRSSRHMSCRSSDSMRNAARFRRSTVVSSDSSPFFLSLPFFPGAFFGGIGEVWRRPPLGGQGQQGWLPS